MHGALVCAHVSTACASNKYLLLGECGDRGMRPVLKDALELLVDEVEGLLKLSLLILCFHFIHFYYYITVLLF